jgi:hypothetical protein
VLQETASERILRSSNKAPSVENVRQVISDAGAHLKAIDEAVKIRTAKSAEGGPALETSLLAAINPLLDLLVIEGVYPSISLQIGFRDRLGKTQLVYNKDEKFPDLDILQTVLVDILDPIVSDAESGISSQVRDRILTDLIVANFDLTFSPERENSVQDASKQRLDRMLKG